MKSHSIIVNPYCAPFPGENMYIVYNSGHNILELYIILVQVRFTTSKTKIDT